MMVTVWALTLMETTSLRHDVLKTAPCTLSEYVLPSTSNVAMATPFWLVMLRTVMLWLVPLRHRRHRCRFEMTEMSSETPESSVTRTASPN